MRILVAGWFSFKEMGTTAGDLIAKNIVCDWLENAHVYYDVAVAADERVCDGINWLEVDPLYYSDVIFVCGPFGNGWPLTNFLARFSHARIIGINLSLLQTLEEWNPFTLLYERDSSRISNPDITFFAPSPKVPVVGVILAHKQKEYGRRSLHEQANAAIEKLLSSAEYSVVPIDTVLENNAGGLRTAGQIESLVAKMDVVVTTRLHGTVLALKNGVPVIPIDPIDGGAKISKQVKILEWPILFEAHQLEQRSLMEAFEYCKTASARQKANACAQKAKQKIALTRQLFLEEISALSHNENSQWPG